MLEWQMHACQRTSSRVRGQKDWQSCMALTFGRESTNDTATNKSHTNNKTDQFKKE
jgi:hypothetical protein